MIHASRFLSSKRVMPDTPAPIPPRVSPAAMSVQTAPTSRKCPHCRADAVNGAAYCSHCARRMTDYITCSECGEPAARGAKYCPFCTQRIRHYRAGEEEPGTAPDKVDITFVSRPIGAFLTTGRITALFKPPVIHIESERITIDQWHLFGLKQLHEEIDAERIASIRHGKAVFWSTLMIETFGGSSEPFLMPGLSHRECRNAAAVIRALSEPLRKG